MRALLIILALLIFLMGLASLFLPCLVIASFFTGNFQPIVLIIFVPMLLFSYVAFKYSVAYLRKRNEKTANPIATLTGVSIWLLLCSPMETYAEQMEGVTVDIEGSALFELNTVIVFGPIIIGIVVTRLLKHGIRKSFPKQDGDQVIAVSQPLSEA